MTPPAPTGAPDSAPDRPVGTPLVPYGQGRARGLGVDRIGTHGAQVESLMALGLPTVAGLTVPVGHAHDLTNPAVARAAVALVEEMAGRTVAAGDRPLLLRLIPSAAVAASGLPPEIAPLGLDPDNAASLVGVIGRSADLHDAWAQVLALLATDALGVDPDELDDAVAGVADPEGRVEALLQMCAQKGSSPVPDDPAEQLALAATALLARWDSPRGRRVRKAQRLPEDLGLALHVQTMQMGPWERSGHGAASSRHPDTGALTAYGSFHRGVRRSAVATAGAGEPLTEMPGGTDLLTQALATLEHHLKGPAHVTFELRDARLSLLTACPVERPTPRVATRVAVELAEAGTVSRAEALLGVAPQVVQELLHAQLRLDGSETLLATGLAASPGAATGLVALSSQRALELAAGGVGVVLVSTETTPGDIPALLASEAVVTTAGGLASHAAVVARGNGTPAVCGVSELVIDLASATVTAGGQTVAEGQPVTVDGRTGRVYIGEVQVRPASPPVELDRLLAWADDVRTLGVRTNADTAGDTEVAIRLGAEGIGLCRTEHQFLGDRLPVVRRFLLATDDAARAEALQGLIAAQCEDFTALLRAVGDRPVTVRLLDAPLHEFLPSHGDYEDAEQAHRAVEMREVNPMLGVRGVRLALLNTDLYPAQAEALFTAWQIVRAEGVTPQLEVMIPLVSLPEELEIAIEHVHHAARRVAERTGVKVPYTVGSMIETPRAALLAGRLAEMCDFLSFGTNDLTQMTYGFSRDDVESRLLTCYLERGLLTASPFQEFDPDGVGELVSLAISRARAVKPGIKLGVCGEHGGDATSVLRLALMGLDYVSCSPQRVPVARLAAAHAALGVAADPDGDDWGGHRDPVSAPTPVAAARPLPTAGAVPVADPVPTGDPR